MAAGAWIPAFHPRRAWNNPMPLATAAPDTPAKHERGALTNAHPHPRTLVVAISQSGDYGPDALRHVRESDPWCCDLQHGMPIPGALNPIQTSDHRLPGACRQDPMGALTCRQALPIALVDEGEPVVFIMPPDRGRDVPYAKGAFGTRSRQDRRRSSSPPPNRATGMMNYADVVFPASPNARR